MDGNVFSNAYYDFSAMSDPIYYNTSASYDKSVDENHWIYTCWFRTDESVELDNGALKLGKLYLKEKDYWYFEIVSSIDISVGDEVTIYRATAIKLNGIVHREPKSKTFALKIKAGECLAASRKIPNWWANGVWKIQKQLYYNLLTCKNGDADVFKIDVNGNSAILRCNGSVKLVSLTQLKTRDLSDWHYIAFDFSPRAVNVILVQSYANTANKKRTDKVLINTTEQFTMPEFSFDAACIDNCEKEFNMTNIRLYENIAPLGDAYKEDMYSMVTRNASKLIIVDSPNPSNKQSFITKMR